MVHECAQDESRLRPLVCERLGVIDPLEHKAAELVHHMLRLLREGRVAALLRGDDHIRHHARDHRGRINAERIAHLTGQFLGSEKPRAQAVVIVVAEIGDAVGNADDPPLKRARHPLARVVQDAVADRAREVQPASAALEDLDHAQALLVVRKMSGDLRHHCLACMPERRMPDIVSEGDRLRQVLVETQPARDRARDLRHLERVRHARPIVVARNDVDLRLVLEPAKRFGVQDAVTITLKLRAEGTLLHRMAALCICAARCQRRKECILLRLKSFPDGQRHPPPGYLMTMTGIFAFSITF